jgi:hypothetical protein
MAMRETGMDAARKIMTMRRLFIGTMLLTGLSVISWLRADGSAHSCCEPICAVDGESCTGGNHDEALQRYRTNQARHWRQLVISSR